MSKYEMDVYGNIRRTPRDSTKDMRDPGNAMAFLAEAMGRAMVGDPDPVGSILDVETQRGQREVVSATTLPTKYNFNKREDFEALGIVFGDVIAGDPMWQDATLPEGWTREARGDTAYWSYLVDEKGEERVSIFYKSAFYDRDAFMNVVAQCTSCAHSTSAHPYKGRIEDPNLPMWEHKEAPKPCEREGCECPDMVWPPKGKDD